MYDNYLNTKQAQSFLGLGRNTVLRLCQERLHNFPAVKVGNTYHIDAERLKAWKDDWFDGKFSIS